MGVRRLIRRPVGVVVLAVGLVVTTPAGMAAASPARSVEAGSISWRPAQGPDPTPDPGGSGTESGSGGGSGADSPASPTSRPTATPQPEPQPADTTPPSVPSPPATSSPSPAPDPTAAGAQAEAARAAEELARRQAAEEAAARERAAARAAAKAAAAAAKAAAALAAARQRAAVTWQGRGRPNRMIVVRDVAVEVVSGGRLTAQQPRPAGPMTLATLNRLVPAGWLTLADGAARLSAVVNLTPGTTLDLGGVRTLSLAGGATPAEAASIYTGSGRLTGRGVTVTSVDPATNQAMAPGAGRPFIVVAGGGRLDTTDATFSDLGTLPDDPDNRAGVQFNPGSGGSLERTAFLRNSVGLLLSASRGVRLDDVRVGESATDGLVLQGDLATRLHGIVAEGNGGNGVLVKGDTSDRPITGIRTAGNGAYGLAVVGQTAPLITGVVTAGDRTGGLRVNRCRQVRVSDFTATDQPIAVFTHVGSSDLRLERLRISGGRRGVVVEKSTTGLELTQTSIDGASVVGVSIGGHDVRLDGVSVAGSRTGVRIERGAGGITTTGLTLTGGDSGFVANPGSSGVVLRDFVVQGIGDDAVRTFSPGARISGGRITGAATGIVTGAATSIADTAISQVGVGLRSRAGAEAAADRIDVAALTVGVDADPGRPVQLRDSRVHALQAMRGEVRLLGFNELSLPPLNLLGAIGVPLVLLAVLLELVHSLRQRRFGRGHQPPPLLVRAGA
jgi:hypothetical protein